MVIEITCQFSREFGQDKSEDFKKKWVPNKSIIGDQNQQGSPAKWWPEPLLIMDDLSITLNNATI